MNGREEGGPLPRASAQRARQRAGHALRSLSLGRVRRAAAAPQLGPDGRRAHGASNAQRLAVTSGGTIPDRGLFGVFITGEKGTRVGELDEEMVYESRPGETFVLGASTWLIEDITHDRVLVTPAPGQPGKMPFWHGDALGRPIELGRALGAFIREITALDAGEADANGSAAAGLDEYAAQNLLGYLQEQKDRRRRSFPTTARSWSSVSGTSWGTGASASTRSSEPRCTRRGPRRSRLACGSVSGSRCRRCTRTTASSCDCRRHRTLRRRNRS